MPTQKSYNKNIRKLTKVGGLSLSVTLPIEIVRTLKWREKQKLVVKKRGKKVVITDWPHSAPSYAKATDGKKASRGKKK